MVLDACHARACSTSNCGTVLARADISSTRAAALANLLNGEPSLAETAARGTLFEARGASQYHAVRIPGATPAATTVCLQRW